MYELSLCSGAGGGLLATRNLLGWKTLCYVERDSYCVEVLKARIRDGFLDDAPIWGDLRSFTKRNNQCRRFIRALAKARAELVLTAGFPCQPFSQAGKQLADRDERNLWPDVARVIREIRPAHVLLENVPGLLASGRRGFSYFGRVLGDLAASGYRVRWDCLPASAVGANHQRNRLWIVAHAESIGWRARRSAREGWEWEPASICTGADIPDSDQADALRLRHGSSQDTRAEAATYPNRRRFAQQSECDGRPESGLTETQWNDIERCGENVADSDLQGQSLYQPSESGKILLGSDAGPGGWWEVEPRLGRVVDGVAHRVDRIRAIGNGQVPAVVAFVWRMLSEF